MLKKMLSWSTGLLQLTSNTPSQSGDCKQDIRRGEKATFDGNTLEERVLKCTRLGILDTLQENIKDPWKCLTVIFQPSNLANLNYDGQFLLLAGEGKKKTNIDYSPEFRIILNLTHTVHY